MIKKDEMLPLLVAASPGFKKAWEDFQNEGLDEQGELPLYVILSDYARYLIEKLSRNDTSDFGTIFKTVEHLHTDGDPYVKNAVTVGLLESIQNNMGHLGKDPKGFCAHLGPESLRWWEKLNEFWSMGRLMTDDSSALK